MLLALTQPVHQIIPETAEARVRCLTRAILPGVVVSLDVWSTKIPWGLVVRFQRQSPRGHAHEGHQIRERYHFSNCFRNAGRALRHPQGITAHRAWRRLHTGRMCVLCSCVHVNFSAMYEKCSNPTRSPRGHQQPSKSSSSSSRRCPAGERPVSRPCQSLEALQLRSSSVHSSAATLITTR